MCKKPWSAVKFRNWDVESEKCPKTVFCPGAKNPNVLFPQEASARCLYTASLSLSWQMSVQDALSLSTATTFPSASFCVPASSLSLSLSLSLLLSLSLSLSLPHPLLSSEAWLTWERMSSLRQLSGLASGRVAKRKRENIQRPVSCSPRGPCTELRLGEHRLSPTKILTLSTCYCLFCSILSSLTETSSTSSSQEIITPGDQTHRSLAAIH